MKKVLITGIDSFTGNHLSRYLKAFSYDVYGTSLFQENDTAYKCDITKKEEIAEVLKSLEPDYIIHLAAISFVAHADNEAFYKVNTIGSLNILETLIELEQNPSKIILVSSATVYGNLGKEILDESLCPQPSNHYGASKYAMETLARNYFKQLNILITRPFNYTGRGQTDNFLIPKIVKAFKEKKETLELGNLDVRREFNDIDFVCEVYKRLLESDSNSQTFNIASRRGVKLLEVIDLMQEIAGYKIQIKVNPDFVRKDEIKTLTGSSEKLFSMIGKVEQKEFKETLREMFEA